MANPEHVAKLKEGLRAWDEWRMTSAEEIFADLTGADLSAMSLVDADLSGVDLAGGDLSEADLARANLYNVNLTSTNLIGADLSSASLRNANLNGANLNGANLMDANLIGADLSGANLGGTKLCDTVFGYTDLTNAKGLDACKHEGPSFLDHATIVRSGMLPLAFLRGCGLPDSLISYLPSLLNQAIHFYSCFISYSSKDQEFADRLHADLQNNGVRCWFAPHDMMPGKKIHEQIDEAIRVYDRLLLILSEDSMGSEWVKTEIAKARKREVKEKRRMLFPVSLVEFQTLQDWECFDADTGKDSAREIREFFIPDFRIWKNHDSYQEALHRLVRALEAKE